MPDIGQLGLGGLDFNPIGKVPLLSQIGIAGGLVIVIGAIFFAIMISLGVWFFIWWRKYNHKISYYRKVGGKVTLVGYDKGWLRKIGTAGDYWLVTMKTKDVLPRPNIYMDRRSVWYYHREDGELINIGMEDIDERFRSADVKFIDQDMRLGRLSIQKALRDELKKQGFWEKYGHWITMLIFAVIILVLIVLVTYRLEKVLDFAIQAQEASKAIAQELVNLRNSIGGGAIPVD